MISQAFEAFVGSLQIDNQEDIQTKFKSITKRLNTSYWETLSEEDHGNIVGSVGRYTAIKGISDLDMLFVLPDHMYKKYNEWDGNGQSALLQDVKNEIKKRYPHKSTIVRGDGQVVVITFTNYEVEICPAFEENNGSYTYPDSNNGGKWKRTDPMPEIGVSEYMIEQTGDHFKYICQIVRAWKNHIGFKMGGLLIDSLVNKFFAKYPNYTSASFDDYLSLLKDLFAYLKDLNKDQNYWHALGSNQRVYNKDGAFVAKAQKAYEKIKDLEKDSENLYEVMEEVFGSNFPSPVVLQKSEQTRYTMPSYAPNEEFIENLFPVDIKFRLRIDCEISMNGFRQSLLRIWLKQKKSLLPNKRLKFFIDENELADKQLPYSVYWKVRNRGEEAVRRNLLRGEIIKANNERTESTSFKGGHYVECYIIHNGVCVARDSIKVPIAYQEVETYT